MARWRVAIIAGKANLITSARRSFLVYALGTAPTKP
jgi:hypothetical protein